jgi:hypothetical protein
VLAITGVLIFHATVGDYLLANTTMVLVAGMFFVIRGESVRSGVLLGVLTAAFPKPMLIPFLLWALVWRPRPLAGVAIGGAAATVLGLVVAGIGLHLTFVDTLVHGGGITVRFAGNYGLSLVSPALAAVVAVFVMVALSVVLVRRGPIVGLVRAPVRARGPCRLRHRSQSRHWLGPYGGARRTGDAVIGGHPALRGTPRAIPS